MANVIAHITSIATTLQPDLAAFRTTMDSLNLYMSSEAFPV